MDQTGQDAWFFSRDGQQSGPLRFEEIRAKAMEGVLRPRTDLVWRRGMPDWRPIGEIEGLFERVPAEPVAAANPYVPPKQSAAAEVALYGEWPGARRRTYLFLAVILPFLLSFIFGLMAPALSESTTPRQVVLFSWGLNGAVFALALLATLRRLSNLGMSRWWFLGSFVPILNLWVGYRTFACPAGYAVHRKMDGAGVFLAIVYWLMVVAAVLALLAGLWIVFNAGSDPEMRNWIRQEMERIQPKGR